MVNLAYRTVQDGTHFIPTKSVRILWEMLREWTISHLHKGVKAVACLVARYPIKDIAYGPFRTQCLT